MSERCTAGVGHCQWVMLYVCLALRAFQQAQARGDMETVATKSRPRALSVSVLRSAQNTADGEQTGGEVSIVPGVFISGLRVSCDVDAPTS
jgi:hypothetical protein